MEKSVAVTCSTKKQMPNPNTLILKIPYYTLFVFDFPIAANLNINVQHIHQPIIDHYITNKVSPTSELWKCKKW